MKLKFIPDKERNFNKEDEKDFLEYSNYVSNLENIIKNAPDASFTIGLFGSWGSGKSSIINTVKDNFKDDEKIKFITYDAWKYSDDSFRRTFLNNILKDSEWDSKLDNQCYVISKKSSSKSKDGNENKNYNNFYSNIQKDISTNFKINWNIIIILGIIFLVFLGLLFIFF